MNKKRWFVEYDDAPKITILEDLVDEKTKERSIKAEVIWQQAGVINRNKRRYSKEILQREIDKVNEQIERKSTVWGAAFHPEDGIGRADENTHRWDKLWMEDEGICKGLITVVPTSSGKDIQVQLKNGNLPLSSRGFGTFTMKEEEVDGKKVKFYDINNDFELRVPGDFVNRGSVPVTGVTKLIESQLNEVGDLKNTGDSIMEIKTVEDMEKAYPELVKSVTKAADETASKDLDTKITAAIAEKEKEWQEGLEKKVEEKIEALENMNKKLVESVKVAVTALTGIEGVVDEDVNNNNDDGNKDAENLKKEMATMKTELETLKQEKIDKEAAEKKATEKVALQKEIRAKFDELLKEDNYKTLVEKELVDEDGLFDIESVDKVEETIKTTKGRISTMIAEARKLEIEGTGLKPIGKVKDPDTKPTLSEEQITRRWQEAKDGGWKGTLDEYRKGVLKIEE